MKRCFGLIVAMLFILALIPTPAHATTIIDNGSCGDSVYFYLDNSYNLVIYGTGNMFDYSYSTRAPWYSLRDYIKTVTIEEGVTSIGDYAFAEFPGSVESFEIPTSLLKVGYNAFDGCGFSSSFWAEIQFPEGLVSIGGYAFDDCLFTSFTIPSTVQFMGSYVFDDCQYLSTLYVLPVEPPSIAYGLISTFDDSFRIYVPSASVADYESATYWEDYANWIVGGVTAGMGSGNAGSGAGGTVTDGNGFLGLYVTHEERDYFYLDTTVQFYANYDMRDWPDFDKSVIWSVDGNSSETVIDQDGLLTIGSNERARYLTVTATSQAYPTLSSTSVIQVTLTTEEEAAGPADDTAALLGKLDGMEMTVYEVQDQVGVLQEQVEELPNQFVDGMGQLMEQQQQQAENKGEQSAQEVIDMIPDQSGEMLDALGTLVSVLNYNGTEAVLVTPAIKLPGIDGLFPGATLLEPQVIDFEYYFTLIPDMLMKLIKALFDVAIVSYCVKELLGLIGEAVNGFANVNKELED